MVIDRALVIRLDVEAESIDQPSTRREKVSEYDGAIELAFSGAVFGDVSDPRSVRLIAGEAPFDQIDRGDGLAGPAEALAGRRTSKALVLHSSGHLVVADDDPAFEAQLGLHSGRPICASGTDVNLFDDTRTLVRKVPFRANPRTGTQSAAGEDLLGDLIDRDGRRAPKTVATRSGELAAGGPSVLAGPWADPGGDHSPADPRSSPD